MHATSTLAQRQSLRCTKHASRRPSLRVQCVKTQDIVVKSSLSDAQLQSLGVRSWPVWSCGTSCFPWTYDANETCYVLEGSVVVTPDGGNPVSIKAGDMATFPSGMSCTWDVKSPIKKHYNFH